MQLGYMKKLPLRIEFFLSLVSILLSQEQKQVCELRAEEQNNVVSISIALYEKEKI